jgi:hypothetical protein
MTKQNKHKQQRKQQRERANSAKEQAVIDKKLERERELEAMSAAGRQWRADLEAVARYRAYVKASLSNNPDWLPEMGVPREVALTQEQFELMEKEDQSINSPGPVLPPCRDPVYDLHVVDPATGEGYAYCSMYGPPLPEREPVPSASSSPFERDDNGKRTGWVTSYHRQFYIHDLDERCTCGAHKAGWARAQIGSCHGHAKRSSTSEADKSRATRTPMAMCARSAMRLTLKRS